MLARIRASLNHPTTASAPEELPPFLSQTPAADSEGLIDEFSEEVEKVGGRIARVSSVDEIRKYIEGLLVLSAAAPVAVSDGRLIQELGIRDWLLSRNTHVVNDAQVESQPGYEPATEVTAMKSYKRALLECGIGITSADYALAETGTLVLISGRERHRLLSLLPPVHVCVLAPARIFPSLTQLLEHVGNEFYARERPPQVLTCITGPSRTADIEQTITTGVHGPKELHVLIYSPCPTCVGTKTASPRTGG